jgi:anti-sigma-K factor RskA
VHDQLRDQAEPYALGTLPPSERQAFEAHLAMCTECAAEVRALAPVAAALGWMAPAADPSPEGRRRLLARVAAGSGLESPRASQYSRLAVAASVALAVAASVALAVGLGVYAVQLRGRVSTLETRLREATLRVAATDRQMADARRTALEAQSAVAVIAAPDLARIDLAGQPVAPSAAARAFWSRSRGLVFTASNLPAPPPGRTYQLWVLTAQSAPISAGLMKPDANGRVNTIFETPRDLPKPVAMAVTLEPDGGVPAPTGDKYLVGLAG